jgi:hypothetical protein
VETKLCVRCNRELPVSAFYSQPAAKDGYRRYCKWCYREVSGRDYNQVVTPASEGYKRCSSCGEIKLLNEFHKQKSTRDGYRNQCKLCRSNVEGIGYKQPAPTGFRRCARCREAKPATYEFFYTDPRHEDNCTSQCRQCLKEKYQRNRERYLDARHIVYEYRKDEINQARRQVYRENPEAVLVRNRAFYARNIEQSRAQSRNYYYRNRPRLLINVRTYQQNNQEAVREWRRKRYYLDIQKSRNQARLNRAKRYSLEASLPWDFTEDDWKVALEYFNYRCAICGSEPEGQLKLAMDHWIALADKRPDNPGTVPHNIIPLCHGIQGCNTSKGYRDAAKWLTEKLGAEIAAQKLQEIQAYFEYVQSIKMP